MVGDMRLNEGQRIRSESSRIPSGIIWRDRRRLMFIAVAVACLSLRTIVLNQHLQTKFKTSVRSQDPTTNIPPSKSISTRRTSAPNPFPSSDNPTRNLTRSIPSKDPTGNPTYRPNDNPTESPAGSPTNDPSKNPTYPPTPNPALRPTVLPTNIPTKENNTNNHHTNREIAIINNADPKILLLITTHLTDEHVRYFDCCWPRLMEKSKLLNLVHVLLFTNNPLETYNTNVASRIRALFANNPSVTYQHAPQQSLNKIGRESNKLKFPRDRERVRKQLQATLPMRLGFEQHWFHGYDWVIRINPDVLIRNSTWLMDAMAESSPNNGTTNEKHYKLDAILHPCKDANHTHTDFLAFRPAALPNNNNTIIPFSVLYEQNHEFTAAQVFRSVLESKRFSQVMGAEPSGKHCRIQGQHSSVYHEHDSCQQLPWVNHANHDVGYGDLFCNALYGWEIT